MTRMQTLNLFYEQPPKRDKRFPYDRYLQRLRRIVKRGTAPAGQMRMFLNLCKGLERIGVPYRVNDYDYIKRHPTELACIVGKENVLNKLQWRNPILYGPNVYDHPSDDPELLNRLPIRKIIVTSEWFRRMCEPHWGSLLTVWRVGVDTELWKPGPSERRPIDMLVYNKVMKNYESRKHELVIPILRALERRGLKVATLRYGSYREGQFLTLLKRSKAMLFLSEHETQGLARLQAHSCGLPVLAWDKGGFWENPAYFPHKVRFSPVSSVPDWDARCGVKFKDMEEFPARLEEFLNRLVERSFAPREYILENFTLEQCAGEYLKIVQEVQASLNA